jgi:hypothetical protein
LLKENIAKAISGDYRTHDEKLADFKVKIENKEI